MGVHGPRRFFLGGGHAACAIWPAGDRPAISARWDMDGADDETRLVKADDEPSPSDDAGVAEGTVLSHTYRVERLLARGGMGEVYRARHVKLGTEHAIKIMLPELAQDARVIDLFTREAAVLRNVRNLVLELYHSQNLLDLC